MFVTVVFKKRQNPKTYMKYKKLSDFTFYFHQLVLTEPARAPTTNPIIVGIIIVINSNQNHKDQDRCGRCSCNGKTSSGRKRINGTNNNNENMITLMLLSKPSSSSSSFSSLIRYIVYI